VTAVVVAPFNDWHSMLATGCCCLCREHVTFVALKIRAELHADTALTEGMLRAFT
jgi:hypothetical protein